MLMFFRLCVRAPRMLMRRARSAAASGRPPESVARDWGRVRSFMGNPPLSGLDAHHAADGRPAAALSERPLGTACRRPGECGPVNGRCSDRGRRIQCQIRLEPAPQLRGKLPIKEPVRTSGRRIGPVESVQQLGLRDDADRVIRPQCDACGLRHRLPAIRFNRATAAWPPAMHLTTMSFSWRGVRGHAMSRQRSHCNSAV